MQCLVPSIDVIVKSCVALVAIPVSLTRASKTEGLHRKYPLSLRSMGHFVCKQQAPTVNERRLVDEIRQIQIFLDTFVANLTTMTLRLHRHGLDNNKFPM
jgi:hypothetical protein